MRLLLHRQTSLQRAAIEGESPVAEMKKSAKVFLSTVGHVKSGRNLGGPAAKAKQMPRAIADSTVRER